jgi:Putative prokaryotic signal transducing protein
VDQTASWARSASCYDAWVSHRVRIGTCSGPADAALVRSMLSAHGIAVIVGAENHAGLLAGLGGGFLSLDIWVDEEDREEAEALLCDLRERDESGDHGTEDDAGDAAEADGADPGESGSGGTSSESMRLRIDRRYRTLVVLLLGCCITFGTAHMFAGAWMQGITLAAIEAVGIMHVRNGHTLGGFVIAAAILTDVIGALWHVWTTTPSALPRARVRNH